MLALEEHFDVEFLDRMLGRKTFGSIRALNAAIAELRGENAATCDLPEPVTAGAAPAIPAQAGSPSPTPSVQP
jgi:hypothetical protein